MPTIRDARPSASGVRLGMGSAVTRNANDRRPRSAHVKKNAAEARESSDPNERRRRIRDTSLRNAARGPRSVACEPRIERVLPVCPRIGGAAIR